MCTRVCVCLNNFCWNTLWNVSWTPPINDHHFIPRVSMTRLFIFVIITSRWCLLAHLIWCWQCTIKSVGNIPETAWNVLLQDGVMVTSLGALKRIGHIHPRFDCFEPWQLHRTTSWELVQCCGSEIKLWIWGFFHLNCVSIISRPILPDSPYDKAALAAQPPWYSTQEFWLLELLPHGKLQKLLWMNSNPGQRYR